MKVLLILFAALLVGMTSYAQQSNNSLSFAFFKPKPSRNIFFKKDSVSLFQQKDTVSFQKPSAVKVSMVLIRYNSPNEMNRMKEIMQINVDNAIKSELEKAYLYAPSGIGGW